jgi:hypothetical protein
VRTALSRFAGIRDQAVMPIFDVVDQIAGYQWNPAQPQRHLRELSAAMNTEAALIAR